MSTPLRILFLLTQDLDSPGGLGRYFPLARALAERGHQVKIAALHPNWAGISERRFVKDGVQVEYVAPMHVIKVGSQKKYYSPLRLIGVVLRATWALTRVALTTPADIIQVGKPHPMNSLAGLLAQSLQGKALCVDCDDYEMANLHFGGGWQKFGVQVFEILAPRRADAVTAHTHFLRDHLISLGVTPEHFTYLPHGADHKRFAQVDQAQVERIRAELGLAGKQVVAFIGSLSLPSHPVELLLEAFQRVHAARPQAVLLIVGGGEEYDRLVKRAQELELGEAVIFRGRVPGSEPPLYCRLADVQAEPVIDNTVGRSSLPLKMFESWVSGVPFITGDVGDRGMVMGNPPAGLLVRPGDPEALAEAILQILSDPELAAELRARGFARADEYSWERLAERMEAVYQKVSKPQHGSRR